MKLTEGLLNLLFPPKCPFCRTVLDEPGVCETCRKTLPWTQEGETLRVGPGDLVCVAPLFYEDAVRDCLLRLKFSGGAPAAEPLGRLVAQCAAEQLAGRFDTVTWVPVGPKRLRSRGYDQARLLAEAACRCWGVRPQRLLAKPMDNPAQSGLNDAAARRANVLGAYLPAPGAMIPGRRILLIDDICTTGATLAACAGTLMDAGAAQVVCAAVALTRSPAEGRVCAEVPDLECFLPDEAESSGNLQK